MKYRGLGLRLRCKKRGRVEIFKGEEKFCEGRRSSFVIIVKVQVVVFRVDRIGRNGWKRAKKGRVSRKWLIRTTEYQRKM